MTQTRLMPVLLNSIREFLIDVGNDLDGAKVGLIGADFNLLTITNLASLTQIAFTTYALGATALIEAADSEGNIQLIGPPEIFSPSDAVGLPQLAWGAFIVNAADALLVVTKFDAAIPVTAALQQLHVTPKVAIPTVYVGGMEAGLG